MIDFEALSDSPYLIDLLIQMEDILDSLDVYVFKNWSDGEIVEGPTVRRYWLDMTLKYPIDKTPDPKAAHRLLKFGVRVSYDKTNEGADAENTNEVWLVKISIPRRLVVEINAGQLDFYDDDIDAEDVQDARDSGVSEDGGYRNEDQNGGDAS